MSPGSISHSSYISTVEDVSSRRERLWAEQLGRQKYDVDTVVAGRLNRRSQLQANSVEKTKGFQETNGVNGRLGRLRTVRADPLGSDLFILQTELLDILRHSERLGFGKSTGLKPDLERGNLEYLDSNESDLGSLKSVKTLESACRSELEDLKLICFKPLPTPAFDRLLRVHRTLNKAVESFFEKVSSNHRTSQAVACLARTLLDTVSLLCGVVGNVTRNGSRMKKTPHLDVLEWVISKGGYLTAWLALASSSEFGEAPSESDFGRSRPRQRSKSSLPKVKAVRDAEDSSIDKLMERSASVKAPKRPPLFTLRPETPDHKDEDYWRTVERTATVLIDDIMSHVDGFLYKAENDAIKKVLDQEIFS